MKSMKSVLYRKEKIDNKERHFGAAEQYYPAWVVDSNGKERFALFLETEVERALYRGERNPEDLVPKMSGFRKFVNYLKGLIS